jgi:hypothetical protein
MRYAAVALLSLGFAAQTVRAFTNGTLLPSYICNDLDGYPKSAGTLIPYLLLGTAADNYNQFPPGNATNPIIAFGDNVVPNVTAVAPTATAIIGAFHNGGAQLDANGNPVVPVVYETATLNPVWLAPNTSNPSTGAGDYTIKLGQINTFVVAAHCPAPDPRGYNNAGVAIDGFMAYAIDTATGQRIGTWVNVGPTMQAFYACNPKGNAFATVGVVHNQLLSCNSNVAGLTWMAPANVKGTIMFKGAGCSDCAFGPFSVIYNTTANMTAPSPTAQGLTPNLLATTDPANNLAAYVPKLAAPDLPGSAQAMAAIAAGQTTPAAGATTTMMMYTPGQTAGIAVGGAIAGALVVGTIMFFLGRRAGNTSSNGAVLL